MKKVFLFILFLVVSSLLSAQEFGYPVAGEGWYYIKLRLPVEPRMDAGTWKMTRVEVNSVRLRDFILFQRGKEVFDHKLRGKVPFELKARFSWEAGKAYEVRAFFEDEAKKTISAGETVKAPSGKGYWNSSWKNYLSLIVSEEHGCERINYPVQATFGVLSSYLQSPDEIRVVKAEKRGNDISYTEIPCQVYDVTLWKDEKLLSREEHDEQTGGVITRYHPTTTLSVAFQVNLRPHERATYLVFYNNPGATKPRYPSDLSVSGEGLSKTVENSFYKIVLNGKSGMVHEVYEKQTGMKLEHKLETNGSIHWNPGMYSPPHSWSHASDWESPAYSEELGPVFYSLRREGQLPHLDDVSVSITYHFYHNAPFIIMESAMEAKSNLFVKALRNAEVVFNKEVFSRAAFKTVEGRVELIDFAKTRMHPEHVVLLRPDTPWICFLDEEKGIAFASLFLVHLAANLHGGDASTQQPYIYIQHGPWYYLSRAFVYSFGSNNQTRMLPVREGSLYFEKNAWIPFTFKGRKGYSQYLDSYYLMMKYPLRVIEQMETFLESPEGWLVPILTEPFDEGVERALGGKKRDKK